MKKVLAIIGVVVLLSLYVLSFVAAIFNRPESTGLFMASLFATFFIPLMMWIYMKTYQFLKGRGADKVDDTDNSSDNK